MKSSLWFSSLLLVSIVTGVNGGITNYDSLAAYTAAIGAHEIIDFTEVPIGTVLTSQYVSKGVTFSDADDLVIADDFCLDSAGVNCDGPMDILFSTPQTHIGVDFPGAIRIDIYNNNTFIGSSTDFASSGAGFFGGIVSDQAFNRVVLVDWYDARAYIDNLHYNIPEPTTLCLLGLGGLMLRKRKSQAA